MNKKVFLFLLFLTSVILSGFSESKAEYSISQLTNNNYDDYNPRINDSGWVTWYGFDGTDDEIFLYNGTNTTQITYDSFDVFSDQAPRINNSGWVTWYGSDGHDDEIFLYNGTDTTRITNNSYDDTQPQINDSGWQPRCIHQAVRKA